MPFGDENSLPSIYKCYFDIVKFNLFKLFLIVSNNIENGALEVGLFLHTLF